MSEATKSKSQAEEIQNLKELAGLLELETDRWSRQVILAEAAMKLAELEQALQGTGSSRREKRKAS